MANTERKLVHSKSGLRMISIDDSESPFMLTEPQWVPDVECPYCMQCQTKFVLMKRRHHCRRCGRCYCSTCCEKKVSLHRMCFIDPVRQCDSCCEVSRKECEFFDKHIKVLLAGGNFVLVDADVINNNQMSVTCKLSTDHRLLTFEGGPDMEPFQLSSIESVQILTTGTDADGNPLPSGIALKYRNKDEDLKIIKMSIINGPNRRQAMLWVAAMQKAYKMIYETRTMR
ncbi:hypothetical protein ScPMuIL_013695 [Solemya velum]